MATVNCIISTVQSSLTGSFPKMSDDEEDTKSFKRFEPLANSTFFDVDDEKGAVSNVGNVLTPWSSTLTEACGSTERQEEHQASTEPHVLTERQASMERQASTERQPLMEPHASTERPLTERQTFEFQRPESNEPHVTDVLAQMTNLSIETPSALQFYYNNVVIEEIDADDGVEMNPGKLTQINAIASSDCTPLRRPSFVAEVDDVNGAINVREAFCTPFYATIHSEVKIGDGEEVESILIVGVYLESKRKQPFTLTFVEGLMELTSIGADEELYVPGDVTIPDHAGNQTFLMATDGGQKVLIVNENVELVVREELAPLAPQLISELVPVATTVTCVDPVEGTPIATNPPQPSTENLPTSTAPSTAAQTPEITGCYEVASDGTLRKMADTKKRRGRKPKPRDPPKRSLDDENLGNTPRPTRKQRRILSDIKNLPMDPMSDEVIKSAQLLFEKRNLLLAKYIQPRWSRDERRVAVRAQWSRITDRERQYYINEVCSKDTWRGDKLAGDVVVNPQIDVLMKWKANPTASETEQRVVTETIDGTRLGVILEEENDN